MIPEPEHSHEAGGKHGHFSSYARCRLRWAVELPDGVHTVELVSLKPVISKEQEAVIVYTPPGGADAILLRHQLVVVAVAVAEHRVRQLMQLATLLASDPAAGEAEAAR